MLKRFNALALGITVATGALAIGDGPIIEEHLDPGAIEAGELPFNDLFEAGRKLFSAKFNIFDGEETDQALSRRCSASGHCLHVTAHGRDFYTDCRV